MLSRHGRLRPSWSAPADYLRIFAWIDYITVLLAALFLGSLELLLKEAPKRNWHGTFVYVLGGICLLSAALAVKRALRVKHPFVDLRKFFADVYLFHLITRRKICGGRFPTGVRESGKRRTPAITNNGTTRPAFARESRRRWNLRDRG